MTRKPSQKVDDETLSALFSVLSGRDVTVRTTPAKRSAPDGAPMRHEVKRVMNP